MVSKDFSYTLLSPADLREFTGLSTSIILQRQRLALSVSWDLVRWHLQGMYGKIAEGRDAEGVPTMRIMETVDVKHVDKHALAIEWVGGVTNDMIADSVLAVVLGIEGSPASVKSEWFWAGLVTGAWKADFCTVPCRDDRGPPSSASPPPPPAPVRRASQSAKAHSKDRGIDIFF